MRPATTALLVGGAVLALSACGGSGRSLSVTVDSTANVAATHGAVVCLGQPGTDPPKDQCATTNDQGVAQVPVDELEPGQYGIIVFCKGQTQSFYVHDTFSQNSPALVAIPATGVPAARSVHGACGG